MTALAAKNKTWFVSYKTRSGSHHKRRTHTFESEDDAKQFAMQMLVEKKYPLAGTLDPYRPKQVISSFRMVSWASLD
jgi:hypothetical protein